MEAPFRGLIAQCGNILDLVLKSRTREDGERERYPLKSHCISIQKLMASARNKKCTPLVNSLTLSSSLKMALYYQNDDYLPNLNGDKVLLICIF